MSSSRRTGRRTLGTFLPAVALVALAAAGLLVWLVYAATHPTPRAYVVTPEQFRLHSERASRITEEEWRNADGSPARGWLLRGTPSLPAVVLLHPFGGNRSYFLNLGIKLNEATNFTVLWTDARAHGATDPAGASTFGAREATDAADALKHLRTLTTPAGELLVGGDTGLYGVEMGAYSALIAARDDPGVRALVADSIVSAPSELLRSSVAARTGFDNTILTALVSAGARLTSGGAFPGVTACEAAAGLDAQRVLLLAGSDAPELQAATAEVERCFGAKARVEAHTNLPLTGFRLASAPGAAADLYDRRVIEFFDRTLLDAQ